MANEKCGLLDHGLTQSHQCDEVGEHDVHKCGLSGCTHTWIKHPIAICIVCREVIHTTEAIVSSIHGYYHGAPRTCVEGRENEEDERKVA